MVRSWRACAAASGWRDGEVPIPWRVFPRVSQKTRMLARVYDHPLTVQGDERS